mgnify:CR=1 FL=1
MTAPLGVLGLTHTGAIMAVGWAALGFEVVAVDPDPAPLLQMRGEPDWETALVRVRERVVFDTRVDRLGDCRLVFVTRDVQRTPAGTWDYAAIGGLVNDALGVIQPSVLVLTSAVPPGFTRALSKRHPLQDVYYWAETLIAGRALERFLHPEQFIVGVPEHGRRSQEVAAVFLACLDRLSSCPLVVLPYEAAELAKAAINAALAASITLADTLGDFCSVLGLDWGLVAECLRRDARIGPGAYLRPGLGVAGTHLERDLLMLRDLTRAEGLKGAEWLGSLLDQHERRREWMLQIGRPVG